jgi:hypothetical protein
MFQRVGAAVTVLVSATAFTVWNQSVVNEKVYTVSMMTIALLTFLIFRWRDNLGRGKDDNLLILIVFLLGLSLGNHLMAFLVAPAMLFYVIWAHPRTLARWQLYAFASLAWFLGSMPPSTSSASTRRCPGWDRRSRTIAARPWPSRCGASSIASRRST